MNWVINTMLHIPGNEKYKTLMTREIRDTNDNISDQHQELGCKINLLSSKFPPVVIVSVPFHKHDNRNLNKTLNVWVSKLEAEKLQEILIDNLHKNIEDYEDIPGDTLGL